MKKNALICSVMVSCMCQPDWVRRCSDSLVRHYSWMCLWRRLWERLPCEPADWTKEMPCTRGGHHPIGWASEKNKRGWRASSLSLLVLRHHLFLSLDISVPGSQGFRPSDLDKGVTTGFPGSQASRLGLEVNPWFSWASRLVMADCGTLQPL